MLIFIYDIVSKFHNLLKHYLLVRVVRQHCMKHQSCQQQQEQFEIHFDVAAVAFTIEMV